MMINNVICKILHHVDEYLMATITQYVNNNTNVLRKKYCENIFSLLRTFQHCLCKRQLNK